MTTSLDTIRYHSGIAGEEVADMVDSLEQEVSTLREQVKKLTEAYDQSGRTVQDYGRIVNQTELRLHEVATHCANVEQQLAALAEQNEKLREVLVLYSEATSEGYSGVFRACCASRPEEPHTRYCSCNKALSLPDLATIILNKEEGE